MRKYLNAFFVGILLTFSSAFSQATAGDAPTFKSQFSFLAYFAPSFMNVKKSFIDNTTSAFYPNLNLSWRATFDYKQINIYTRMYVVGSAHNDTTGNAEAEGFYYRFDRGYVTYTPLSNLVIRWGLVSVDTELVNSDYIGAMGTNSYGDRLFPIFGSARDLGVYFTYSPTDFLSVKPFLEAPPFKLGSELSTIVGGERRTTIDKPSVGILQAPVFADELTANWDGAGTTTAAREANTGVKAKDLYERRNTLKRILVTPTYGVGLNLHFLEKALQVQLTYKGTGSATQSFIGWVQYNKPDQYFGVGIGGGYAHDYLYVKGQNLGMLDTHVATYFGEKKQHHVLIGNGVAFAHRGAYSIYGGNTIGHMAKDPKKQDFIYYKLQLEATFSVFADNPELFQVSLGYYLDVPSKSVKYPPVGVDKLIAGKQAKAQHTLEITLANFI